MTAGDGAGPGLGGGAGAGGVPPRCGGAAGGRGRHAASGAGNTRRPYADEGSALRNALPRRGRGMVTGGRRGGRALLAVAPGATRRGDGGGGRRGVRAGVRGRRAACARAAPRRPFPEVGGTLARSGNVP